MKYLGLIIMFMLAGCAPPPEDHHKLEPHCTEPDEIAAKTEFVLQCIQNARGSTSSIGKVSWECEDMADRAFCPEHMHYYVWDDDLDVQRIIEVEPEPRAGEYNVEEDAQTP